MSNLKAGTYRVKAIDHKFSKTKTGKDNVVVLLEVIEGECEGEQIIWYGYFTQKCADFTFDALKVLGWDGEDLTTLDGFGDGVAEAVIVNGTDQNGNHKLEVRYINSIGGGSKLRVKNAVEGDDLKALAAKFGLVKKSEGPAF